MTFRDFMNEAAPYESELLLRRYLEQRGIGVEDLQYRRTANHLYTPMLYSLQSNYEDDHGVLQKEKVLIDHEAEQLTALRHQADAGVRVLFVTADLRLLRIIQKEAQLADVAGMCISQLGFVNLVDLFLGGAADNRALARLMWGMPRTNDENMMRDYLVSQALTAYQTSFAVEMPQIVRQVAADVAYKAAQQELPLKDVSSVKVAAASKRLLDTYEAEYFEKLRVAIERSQAVNRTSEASEEPGKSAP